MQAYCGEYAKYREFLFCLLFRSKAMVSFNGACVIFCRLSSSKQAHEGKNLAMHPLKALKIARRAWRVIDKVKRGMARTAHRQA